MISLKLPNLFTGDTDKAEQSAKEMIETYERSFKIIKEITGEQDVQVLNKACLEHTRLYSKI